MTQQTPSSSPFPTSAQMEQMKKDGVAPPQAATEHHKVQETSIDNGVEESFPASDPVSVSITKVVKPVE